eukprot:snap_masked-scaffold_59-processed-gene-0.62-mRNA-1 protein AED:1.00 eAED:1.00 QI:0/0/0/0/1/1/2/0/117
MTSIFRFVFSFPDPISSRDKILEAFDVFTEENNIIYTRNDIKTIILGKNIPNLRIEKSPLLFSAVDYKEETEGCKCCPGSIFWCPFAAFVLGIFLLVLMNAWKMDLCTEEVYLIRKP